MNYRSFFTGLVVLSLIVFCGRNTYGQGRMQGPDRVNQLKKELSLSDKQTEQVKNIFAKFREEMQKVREENIGDREEIAKAFSGNAEKINKEIEKILTPDQKKKFSIVKEQWRKQMEERMKNFGQRNN